MLEASRGRLIRWKRWLQGDQAKLQNSSWQVELVLTQPSFVSEKSLHLEYCMHVVRG